MATTVEQMAGLMPDAKQFLSDEPDRKKLFIMHNQSG